MGIWTYGLHPVHSIGDELAHFVLQVLVPLCALSAFTMYLLLFRLTKRYKIKVYVGSDPMMKKVRTMERGLSCFAGNSTSCIYCLSFAVGPVPFLP